LNNQPSKSPDYQTSKQKGWLNAKKYTDKRLSGVWYINRDLCINKNNHHNPTFHPLGDFLNESVG
jgi:hypothetical protein